MTVKRRNSVAVFGVGIGIGIVCVGCILMAGCGKRPVADKDEVIAYVNKDPIFASDLKREIAMRVRLDPTFKVTPESEAEQLDLIINRKLLIQEAMRKGLAREEKFVSTIKTFWEQTLIRDFAEAKQKDLQQYLFASEDDINDYYDKLSQRATFKVLKSRDRASIDKVYDDITKGIQRDLAWETIGPVSYDDITSSVLIKAFDMKGGETKKLEDALTYYIVTAVNKERIELGPLEQLRDDIEKRVISMKERGLFEEWFLKEKKKAEIKIVGRKLR